MMVVIISNDGDDGGMSCRAKPGSRKGEQKTFGKLMMIVLVTVMIMSIHIPKRTNFVKKINKLDLPPGWSSNFHSQINAHISF